MFTAREIEANGFAGGSEAAAHPHALFLDATNEIGERLRLKRVRSFADRYGIWRDTVSHHLSGVDFAPDLAEDIGSARWFRGVGTLIGLAGAALLMWPDFSSVQAAPTTQIDSAERDEFRSQAIMPLGLGSDTGRHMAATDAVVPLRSAPERPRLDVVATLAQGDSFGRMLQRAGVGSGEAGQIMNLVAGAMPLSDLKSGTKVDIVLGRRPGPNQPRPLESLAFRARFDLELGVERRGGALALDPRPIRVDATPLRITGPVGSSLYRSARAAGAPANAVQKYLRTLGENIDMDSGIRAADQFDLIISYKRAATGESETGELLYAGIVRDGKPKVQLMRWGKEGRFYEASGVGEQRGGLMAPVPGGITSRYGMRRHPILGYTRMHAGLDFRAAYGSPIYAVTDGTVQFAGRHGGHGNYVKLGHGGGIATGYAHMSKIAVRSGQQVRRGQVIGYVGSTGLSTGAHLHYEMYRGGRTVDPSSVKFVTRAQLEGRELQAFKAQLAELQRVTPGAALASLKQDEPVGDEPVREIDRVEHTKEIG